MISERNTKKCMFIGWILGILLIIGPWMGFPTVSGKQPQFGDHALKINGKYVSPEVFKEEQNRFFMRWRRNAVMLRKSDEERNDLLLEEIINRIIIEDYLYNRARVTVSPGETDDYIERYIKIKYNTAAKMDAYLEESHINGMAGLKKNIELYLLKLKCFPKIARELGLTIPQAEIEMLYQQHVANNRQVVLRHILVTDPDSGKARQKAEEIYQQLKNGADFSKLAAQHSADAGTKSNGGLLEPISRQESLPEVADNVFNAKAGDLIPPFQTRSGYEIIFVEKFINYFHPKTEFIDMICIEKFGESDQFKQWLGQIKSKQKIEILDPAMKAYRFFRDGHFNQAGFFYEKAYAVYHFENYLIRAIESYQAAENWIKMIKLSQSGIKKFPEKVPYYLSKAEGLYRSGKTKAALELMKKAEVLAKDNIYYKNLINQWYSKLGFENESVQNIQ